MRFQAIAVLALGFSLGFWCTRGFSAGSVSLSYGSLVESYRFLNERLSMEEREELVRQIESDISRVDAQGMVPVTHYCKLAALDLSSARTLLKKALDAELDRKPIVPFRVQIVLGAAIAAENSELSGSIARVFSEPALTPHLEELLDGFEEAKLDKTIFEAAAASLGNNLKVLAPILKKAAEGNAELRERAIAQLKKYLEIELEPGNVDQGIGQLRVWGALSDLDDLAFVQPVLNKIDEPDLEAEWHGEMFMQTIHFVANWICVDKPTPKILKACRSQLGPAIVRASTREDVPFQHQDTIESLMYARYDYFTEPSK